MQTVVKGSLGDAPHVTGLDVFAIDDVKGLELDPPITEGKHNGGGAVGGAQLSKDVGEMILHGALSNSKTAADGAVAPPNGDVRQYLQLTTSKRAPAAHWRRRA